VLYGSLFGTAIGWLGPVICVALLGGYYAATDGVLAALASATLPVNLRGTGLALLATGTSLGRVAASLAFGVLWTWWGRETALIVFAVGLSAGMVLALRQLSSARHLPRPES
jgi:MFS family permease